MTPPRGACDLCVTSAWCVRPPRDLGVTRQGLIPIIMSAQETKEQMKSQFDMSRGEAEQVRSGNVIRSAVT